MAPNDGRVVSNLIVQALRNKPISIYGDGTQTRSFCFISDMVNALIRLMWTDKGFTGPVNLGNPIEITIEDLAKLIIQETNSKSKIIYKELPKDDPSRRKPDISLAKDKLSWVPIVGIKEGLLKTIEYFEGII